MYNAVKFLKLQVKISVKENSSRENKEIQIKFAYLKGLLRITMKLYTSLARNFKHINTFLENN